MTPVIPRKSNSSKPNPEFDTHLYKMRHLVENLFAQLKHFRSIATPYEKLARNFQSMVFLACALIWTKLKWGHALAISHPSPLFSFASFKNFASLPLSVWYLIILLYSCPLPAPPFINPPQIYLTICKYWYFRNIKFVQLSCVLWTDSPCEAKACRIGGLVVQILCAAASIFAGAVCFSLDTIDCVVAGA